MAASNSSSLVVKISADINDFSKQLNQMTRDVDRASKKIAEMGKSLTIGITIPVAAAAVALSKMAAENEDTGARVERVFGAMAASVNASIKTMMQSVPETQTELQKMAIAIDNMAQGLGLAPQNAAAMSESLLKLAGDASAFAHVPMAEALDALSRGLAGRTKGLLEFGIAISASDIEQRAMQMGLLNTGNKLTETGTALAAYSLIMERSSRITGEAARTAEQSGKSFAFLKRDLLELADQVSALVLPAMSGLAKSARDLVGFLAAIPEPVTKTVFALAAFAAVVGPLLFGLSKLAQTFVSVRAGLSLLAKGEGIIGFFASLTNPVTAAIVGLGALTVAILALYEAYKKLRGATPEELTSQAQKDLANDPTLNAALTKAGVMKPGAGLGGQNAPTQFNPKDQFAQFSENVNLLDKAFENAVNTGGRLNPLFVQLNALQKEGAKLATETAGQFSQQAEQVQNAVAQLQRLADIRNVINSGNPQKELQAIINRPIDVGAAGATAGVDAALKYRTDVAARLGSSSFQLPINAPVEASIQSRNLAGFNGVGGSVANDLALREELLKLPDGFDAARQAAVDLAEAQRQADEMTALEFEKLKIKLGPFGSSLDGLSLGMQRVVVNMAEAVQSFATQLVSTLGGAGKGASTGRGIGGLIGGIGGAFFGPIGAAIGGVVGTGLGGLIGGIFDHGKKSSDAAATSMDNFSKSIDRATASVTNAPEFFKVQQYRFDAAPTLPFLPYDPRRTSGPSSGPGSVKQGNATAPAIHVAGNVIVSSNPTSIKQLYDDLVRQGLKTKGTGTPALFAFAGNGTF